VSDDHPNALTYRRTAEAFRKGDLEVVSSLVADDVTWHVPGTHPLAGDYVGRDRVLELLGSLGALGFTLREHDVFGDDAHLCALSFMGARRDGLEVETRVVSVFHFRNGLQAERWFYPEDAEAWNRIFTRG
jgi:ketosteroid isomerase-like protein